MSVDLVRIFAPSIPILEGIVRGSFLYLVLFLLFRFVLRRQAGALSPSNLLFILLISEATQNGMGVGVRSVTDSLVLIATLSAWDYAIDWLATRSPRWRRVLKPRSLPLVRDGRLERRTMRRELVTRDELDVALRKQGLDKLEDVKSVWLEPDGQISVVAREKTDGGGAAETPRA